MKVKLWNINWKVSDKDYEENLGGLEDDNGLPYCPKDLGLPAWDSEIELEIFPRSLEFEAVSGAIDEALIEKYTFGAWDWDLDIVG